MGWKSLATLSLPLLAALVNPGAAVPITDVSLTTVDVHLQPEDCLSHSPRFVISVHRVDDLLSDSTGALVAQRDQRLEVAFDVAYGGGDSLLLNGHPVHMENAVVKVKAAVAVDGRQLGELEDATDTKIRSTDDIQRAAAAAFDVGLATVAVSVRSSTFLVKFGSHSAPVPVRRFVLSEKVVEVDGFKVRQTNVGEQIYFVGPDGSFVGLSGKAAWAAIDHKKPVSEAAGVHASDAAPLPANTAALKAADDGCDDFNPDDWFGRLAPFQRALVLSSVAVPAMLIAWIVTLLLSRFARKLRARKQESAGGAAPVTAKSLHAYRQLSSGSDDAAVPPSYSAVDVRDPEKALHGADSKDGEGETERDPLCN